MQETSNLTSAPGCHICHFFNIYAVPYFLAIFRSVDEVSLHFNQSDLFMDHKPTSVNCGPYIHTCTLLRTTFVFTRQCYVRVSTFISPSNLFLSQIGYLSLLIIIMLSTTASTALRSAARSASSRSMSAITGVQAREIIDSRGNPTVGE